MHRILVAGCMPGINGIMTCICNLLKHLDRSRFEWEFLVSESDLRVSNAYSLLKPFDVRIHSLDYTPFTFPRKSRTELRRLLESIPDLCGVHLHDAGGFNVYPLYLADQLALPVKIMHFHIAGDDRQIAASRKDRSIMARRRIISDDSFDRLACSEEAGRYAYLDMPFAVFPNAVDPERFSFNPVHRSLVRSRLGICENDIVIGFPGHLWPRKNAMFAAQVFAEFHRIIPESHMIMLGEGSQMPDLRRFFSQHDLAPHIHFLGFQTEIEMFYSAMDLILCTSFREGMPNAMIEAQASGLLCLISDAVSSEVCITDLAKQLPLQSRPQVWAKKIAGMLQARAPRRSHHKEIQLAGYDIRYSTQRLMHLYDRRLIR